MRYSSPKIDITTDASGDFSKTATIGKGLLYKMVWSQGGLASTTDLTITNRHGTTIFTQSNITASEEIYPRVLQDDASGGAALTTHDYILVDGPLTITVAQGGNTLSGSLELFIV